jgi:hypothetical protein
MDSTLQWNDRGEKIKYWIATRLLSVDEREKENLSLLKV